MPDIGYDSPPAHVSQASMFRCFDFRLDKATDEGIVEGHASAFDILEPGYNTIFDQGAFDNTIKRRGIANTAFLLGHGAPMSGRPPHEFIAGDWLEFRTDKKGWWVSGQADLELSYMHDPWINVKKKRLKGLSIGFNPIESYQEMRKGKGGQPMTVTHYKDVDVPEISLVLFKGNPGAGVTRVREMALDKRAVERYLREACGVSRTLAIQHAAQICSLLDPEADLSDSGLASQREAERAAEERGWHALVDDMRKVRENLDGLVARARMSALISMPLFKSGK